MAGNLEAYEQAMNAGHNAAWDQDWVQAITHYGRAITEFPDDAEAHIHLGLGLLEVGRLDDALKVYTRAYQLAPDDPIPLEKSADTLERMGRLREAAQQYVNVAEVYLGQRDLNKAIANWERATHLTPGLIAIHLKLAQAYERIGDKKRAIHEYLTLAYNFQRMGDSDKAIKSGQRALRLDKQNSQVLNTLRALEAGREIMPPTESAGEPRAARAGFDRSARADYLIDEAPAADPLGPLGETVQYALAMLATYVIESGALKATGDTLQAMEAQRQGAPEAAIEAYTRADSQIQYPAIKFNLGALLMLNGRASEAIPYLRDSLIEPQLAPGAQHALGHAYSKTGDHKQAARSLLKCLELLDISDESAAGDSRGRATVYGYLSTALDDITEEALAAMNGRFLALLKGDDWKQRLRLTERQLEETMREQGPQGVIDILAATHSDRLTSSIARIESYMRQGLLTLALDEAHRAVEYSPYYLPVHVRMAEIMMREGRVRNAIAKYNIIAKTYLARGENERAAEILTNVLEMAPLDISVRESLIELLESEERWEEAVDHYIDLADTHHQLGDFDQSRETYILAERIANRVNASPDKVAHIKHRTADIDQMRLDYRRAQKTYEEIIQLLPYDERAHRMLIDLNYRQGNQIEAIRRLDQLLGIYAKKKQVNRITQLLEELVTLYPTDTGLRSRLAAIYRQLGRGRDAIVQLDALGELQLEAGLHKDAAVTIRQIIALNPEHVDDYKRLLAQLGG